MRERNIALIGFRATGKSSVGKILARTLGRHFIDMDKLLISEAGRDIAAWVEQDGWDSFRKAESGLLESVRLKKGLVLATGGGIILDSKNRKVLRDEFISIWLKATPQTILDRMSTDPESPGMRPALSTLPIIEEIVRTLAERNRFYSQIADLEIETEDKSVTGIVEEIISFLNRKHFLKDRQI
jgi:shikimate kinase